MDASSDYEEDSFEAMQHEFSLHDPERATDEDSLSTEDLERFYQQALRAGEMLDARAGEMLDAVERQLPESTDETQPISESNSPLAGTSHGEKNSTRPEVLPTQILEATLFVGGTALTLKKLSRLLGDHLSEEFVEQEIQTLNSRYISQGRPYEITFGEGGYRMVLKSDFDRIRNRVFGLGPKEVKLSQHLLEILAFVAYHQPVTRQQIDEAGPKNSGSLLNQLVRRELVALERTGTNRSDVQYSTTARFLEIFGLRSLEELPHPEDFSFK